MNFIATARKGAAATALASVLFMSTAPAIAQVAVEDCDPAIAATMAAVAEDRANAYVQVADAYYTDMPATGFSGLSCLEDLFSGGMDILFTPPSLSDLLGMLINFACRQADTLVAEATAPIKSAVTGSFNGSTLGMGEILPGVNLSSVTGGVRIRGTNANSVRTNLNGVLEGTGRKPVDIYEREPWPIYSAPITSSNSPRSRAAIGADGRPYNVIGVPGAK